MLSHYINEPQSNGRNLNIQNKEKTDEINNKMKNAKNIMAHISKRRIVCF